jgi:hypothetical protein
MPRISILTCSMWARVALGPPDTSSVDDDIGAERTKEGVPTEAFTGSGVCEDGISSEDFGRNRKTRRSTSEKLK